MFNMGSAPSLSDIAAVTKDEAPLRLYGSK